jgi:ABC-type nitrate/sulfonate/bicarbonate transport system substrate-binding protein
MRALCAALVLSIVAFAANAQPAPATLAPVRVISFAGGWNLPVWAAQRQGFFEANGVAVQVTYTPNSGFLVASLLENKFDVGLALIDNLVAYQEGQGEAKIPENPDLVAFMGVDSGFLSLVTAPDVSGYADLKGKTLSVDAMTTGAAFVLRELLARGGLRDDDVTYVRAGGTDNRYRELVAGKHAATLLRSPYEILATDRGYRVLAKAETLGAYQGTAGYVRQSYAREHEAALVGFMRGFRKGVDFIYDRANRDVVEALLVAHIRDMTPALARKTYDLLLADQGGISRDLMLDRKGIATVLALRSKYATPAKTLGDPDKYVDLRYYDKAFGR